MNNNDIVKSIDYPPHVAAKVFELINPGLVTIDKSTGQLLLIVNVNPKKLRFPEGWCYEKGLFINERQRKSFYTQGIMVLKPTDVWKDE